MQGKPRSGNSDNNTQRRWHNRAVLHYTERELEYCWGAPGSYQETPCAARNSAYRKAGKKSCIRDWVSNCNRTCFCIIKVWAPDTYHEKVVYLSLRRTYSGGMCGSPRLLHRGFQLFRGLMLGTAGWSTTARVVSTTIRKPRTKRTTGEAKRDGMK